MKRSIMLLSVMALAGAVSGCVVEPPARPVAYYRPAPPPPRPVYYAPPPRPYYPPPPAYRPPPPGVSIGVHIN